MKKLLLISLLLITGATRADAPKANEKIELTPYNTVTFRGEVSAESTQDVQLKLNDLVEQRGTADYPIYLVVDSPGGNIYAGEQFIQFVKTVPNLKTISIFAASMASAIVEAIPGQRFITENGILMFHRAKGAFQGQFNDGEVESELRLWKNIVETMEKRNADRLYMRLPEYKEKVKDEYWLYGSDAVTRMAADKVIDITCNKDLTNFREKSEVESLFGSFAVEYSGCPLLRGPLKPQETEKPSKGDE